MDFIEKYRMEITREYGNRIFYPGNLIKVSGVPGIYTIHGFDVQNKKVLVRLPFSTVIQSISSERIS